MTEEHIKQGSKAEYQFIKLIKEIKPLAIIVTASTEQNIHQHIDFIINDCTIDVKSIKNCIPQTTNYTIVEFLNVNMDLGWLYSKELQYIAFQSGTSSNYRWLLVKRTELLDYCKHNIIMQTVPNIADAVNKLYSRGNDLISVVDMDYLRYLPSSRIMTI